MEGVVVFDPAAFVKRFPAFAAYNTANPDGLQQFFDEATMYIGNTPASRVCNVERRKLLLWLLTAHLAYLSGVLNAGGLPGQVGRATNVTEGSVSVGFTVDGISANSAWYLSTPYGAQFWQMTAGSRGFRYFLPRARCC